MSQNTFNNKIIGFYDDEGHAYCIRHGSSHYDCIRNEPGVWDKCEVCGIEIIGDDSDISEVM